MSGNSESRSLRVLALETSGLQGSIALSVAGAMHARQLASAGRRHAQTLTQEIHELLQSTGVAPGDLDAVAVSLGPGSFTGLRVGLVCAKTLAYALKCRVVGIETFQAVAVAAAANLPDGPSLQRLAVVGDAQRGDLFLAEYHRVANCAWQRQGELQIVPGENWLAQRSEDDVVVGSGVAKYRDVSTRARLIHESWSLQPAASDICELAIARLQAGQQDDPWTLSPIYLRPSAAEEQQDRRAGKLMVDG